MAPIMTSMLWLVSLMLLQDSLNTKADAQPWNVKILFPQTLSDSYGNSADNLSHVTYADLADRQTYKSKEKPEDGLGAMGPIYDLSGSLVSTSLPGKFPFEWASKIKENKIDISNDWKKVAVDYLGYTIALVVGIVFFLVFPIVGLCFCCCRCCGRCGGARVIKSAADAGHGNSVSRLAALSFITAFTIMPLIGSVLMFVTNSNLSTSVKDFCSNDIDKFDDLSGFLNSTVQQTEQLVQGNFNFTLAVLFRDLDNIGHLLGIPVRDGFLQKSGLASTYAQIEALESDASTISQYLKTLVDTRALVVDTADTFQNFTVEMSQTLENMAINHTSFNSTVPNRTIITQFNASQLPNEKLKQDPVDGFLKHGISSLTAESKKSVDEIPDKVQNETLKQRTDLKSEVNTYTDQITQIIDNIKKMRTDVMKGLDIEKMKADVKKYADKVLQYDQYRWYGGLGIASITMLIVLLLCLGILLGVFLGNPADDPADRSAGSNAGGNLLMAAVMLTFICVWLTMFLTTILFAAGAPVDKFACGAVRDLSIVDELLNDYNFLGSSGENESWIGSKVYAGKNVSLDLAELMGACKNRKAAYFALKMEDAKVFSLSEVVNYKKKFNVQDKIDASAINFDSINITTGDMMHFIDFMGNFDMDYSTYNNTFQIDPCEPSSRLLPTLMNFHKNQTSGSHLELELKDAITQFEYNLNNSGKALRMHIATMKDALKHIKETTEEPRNNTLSDRCNRLKQTLNSVETNLSTISTFVFNESVKLFENRLLGILDTFVSAVEKAVKNKIGVCRPLWNMYNDVAVNGICNSVVGTLNTWWFTIGWTSFYLVASICPAVRLSKHLRRMQYLKKKSESNAELPTTLGESLHNVDDPDLPLTRVSNAQSTTFTLEAPTTAPSKPSLTSDTSNLDAFPERPVATENRSSVKYDDGYSIQSAEV